MRNQRRQEKGSLSRELENLIYGPILRKREIEALKARCESYQRGEPPLWTGDIYRAYMQYFGALTSLKVKLVLQELDEFGYLDIWGGAPTSLFDFGAGTLGGTLGAIDFFKEKNWKVDSIHAFDSDTRPTDWSRETFKNFLGAKVHTERPSSLDRSLIIAVDVLNEMGLMNKKEAIDESSAMWKELISWIDRATESTVIVLIEPASKEINRNFLALRNHLKDRVSILLPCTHQKNCPALTATDEWCHEERAYKTPSSYWNLVREMGFRRNSLQFSMLCLGKQASKFGRSQARMVSRPLKSKGRCEKWLCADGKRWKASLLSRHENETNAPFFEACRGDIVDCNSTGIKQPD